MLRSRFSKKKPDRYRSSFEENVKTLQVERLLRPGELGDSVSNKSDRLAIGNFVIDVVMVLLGITAFPTNPMPSAHVCVTAGRSATSGNQRCELATLGQVSNKSDRRRSATLPLQKYYTESVSEGKSTEGIFTINNNFLPENRMEFQALKSLPHRRSTEVNERMALSEIDQPPWKLDFSMVLHQYMSIISSFI